MRRRWRSISVTGISGCKSGGCMMLLLPLGPSYSSRCWQLCSAIAGLQILLRQLWRQHIVLARQNGHGVQVFDNELTVRHPQAHICQIAGFKPRLLHRLVERGEQRVVRLVHLHARVSQCAGIGFLLFQQQAKRLLIFSSA